MLVRIVFEIGFGIFNADLATLNSRIHQFGTHIRIQETKLHQNHTLVEKIFFWSKIAFTLTAPDPGTDWLWFSDPCFTYTRSSEPIIARYNLVSNLRNDPS